MNPYVLCFLGGLLLVGPSFLPESKPDEIVNVDQDYSEDEVWKTLVKWVEVHSKDGRISDTDFILVMVDRLKEMSVLNDITRVEDFRSENTIISDSNRDEILRTIKGE